MSDDWFRDRGIDLVERVSASIDVPARLDRLHGRHRHRTVTMALAGGVAVIGLIAVMALLGRLPDTAPVAPAAPLADTTRLLQPQNTSLPVTVYVALLDEFTVDEATAHCTGTGAHVGAADGSLVRLFDTTDSTRRLVTQKLLDEIGALIDPARVAALGLPSTSPACLFELATVSGAPLTEPAIQIDGEEWPPPEGFEAGWSQTGQQLVFYSRGLEP